MNRKDRRRISEVKRHDLIQKIMAEQKLPSMEPVLTSGFKAVINAAFKGHPVLLNDVVASSMAVLIGYIAAHKDEQVRELYCQVVEDDFRKALERARAAIDIREQRGTA